MITQIPISVKIDAFALEDLDKEREASGVNRNKLINQAVFNYLYTLDYKRKYRSFDPEARIRLTHDFLRERLPWLYYDIKDRLEQPSSDNYLC